MIYTASILHETTVKQSVLGKYVLVWNEKDVNFGLGFQKFGIDLENLQPAAVFPRRVYALPLLLRNMIVF